MSNILDFEFEELPLFITKEGIPAGLINGMAAIEYDRDGFVGIDSVSIEGWQQLTPEERARGVRPWVYVKAPAELEHMIGQRLEGEWFGRVQDAINEQLASDREDAREQNLEYRRDRMMEA